MELFSNGKFKIDPFLKNKFDNSSSIGLISINVLGTN